MHIEITKSKWQQYLNLVLSTIGLLFFAMALLGQIINSEFGVWFILILIFAVAACFLVARNAYKNISNKVPALALTDDGLIDNISHLKVGLIRWDEMTGCQLKQYKGYPQILISLKDNSRIIALAGTKHQRYIEKTLLETNACIVINTEQLNFKGKLLHEFIDSKIKKEELFDHHLVQY